MHRLPLAGCAPALPDDDRAFQALAAAFWNKGRGDAPLWRAEFLPASKDAASATFASLALASSEKCLSVSYAPVAAGDLPTPVPATAEPPDPSLALGGSFIGAPEDAEDLALALWNEGRRDEAIEVLERQIALEKDSGRGGDLSPAAPAAAVSTPVAVSAAGSSASDAPPVSGSTGDSASIGDPTEAMPTTTALVVFSGTMDAPEATGRAAKLGGLRQPAWIISLCTGAVVLLVAGASLWTGGDLRRNDPGRPASERTNAAVGTMEGAPMPSRANNSVGPILGEAAPGEPPVSDKPALDELSDAEGPVAALETEPYTPLAAAPVREAAAAAPADPEPRMGKAAAVPASRVPKPRPDPQIAEAAAEPEPPAREGDTEVRADPLPPVATRQAAPEIIPIPRLPDDLRPRLAEKRAAAEQYAARRRALAERSAAEERRAILLGRPGLD